MELTGQVIIVIGLPCSGKTGLSEILKIHGYFTFDDFINDFYNGKALTAIESGIKSGHRVCLIDPRLCILSIFCRYITEIEKLVSREHIQLVLFENDPEACLNNYSHGSNKKRGIDMTIKQYSTHYCLDNYKEWKSIQRPVWKSN